MPRVLVVEDNAEAQSLIAAILGPIGYAVQGAMGGAQGLVLAEADPPDLVLSTIQVVLAGTVRKKDTK